LGDETAVATVELVGKAPLDYAILKAVTPPPYRNDILPVRIGRLPLGGGVALEVIQQWTHYSRDLGKASSRDDDCRITESSPSDLYHCPSDSLKHKCDTEEGSSGSPVFVRGSSAIIALHFKSLGINAGSCALPADAILTDIGEGSTLWNGIRKEAER
jgi:hypothetical protein